MVSVNHREDRIDWQVWYQCQAMAHYAVSRGKYPRPADLQAIDEFREDPSAGLERLTSAHERLFKAIEPILPLTAVTFFEGKVTDEDRAKNGWRAWLNIKRMALGPIPLVQDLLLATMASLFVLLALLVARAIFDVDPNGDVFKLNNGDEVLILAFLYLAAAGVGAGFSGLFRAQRFLDEQRFSSGYEGTYWMRFTLGLVAGLLLATMVPIPSEAADVGRPLLALLGGISAPAVYRILERLVLTIETLVQGDNRERVVLREQNLEARAEQARIDNRNETVMSLVRLRDSVREATESEEVKKAIDKFIAETVQADKSADRPFLTQSVPSGVTAQQDAVDGNLNVVD